MDALPNHIRRWRSYSRQGPPGPSPGIGHFATMTVGGTLARYQGDKSQTGELRTYYLAVDTLTVAKRLPGVHNDPSPFTLRLLKYYGLTMEIP